MPRYRLLVRAVAGLLCFSGTSPRCSMLSHFWASNSTQANDGNAQLTARELEVLTAMADGATNKAIARRLGISFHTVKFHVAAILEKTRR